MIIDRRGVAEKNLLKRKTCRNITDEDALSWSFVLPIGLGRTLTRLVWDHTSISLVKLLEL